MGWLAATWIWPQPSYLSFHQGKQHSAAWKSQLFLKLFTSFQGPKVFERRPPKERSCIVLCVCVCESQSRLFIFLHKRTGTALRQKGVTQLNNVGLMTDSKLKAQCTRLQGLALASTARTHAHVNALKAKQASSCVLTSVQRPRPGLSSEPAG